MRQRGSKITGGSIVASCALVFSACAQSSPKTNTTKPAQACLDMADAVGNAAERCSSGTYQANHDAFIAVAAQGDCNNVVQIRDESSLYSTCIPSFSSVSCADLASGTLDPSCSKQLLHK